MTITLVYVCRHCSPANSARSQAVINGQSYDQVKYDATFHRPKPAIVPNGFAMEGSGTRQTRPLNGRFVCMLDGIRPLMNS